MRWGLCVLLSSVLPSHYFVVLERIKVWSSPLTSHDLFKGCGDHLFELSNLKAQLNWSIDRRKLSFWKRIHSSCCPDTRWSWILAWYICAFRTFLTGQWTTACLVRHGSLKTRRQSNISSHTISPILRYILVLSLRKPYNPDAPA